MHPLSINFQTHSTEMFSLSMHSAIACMFYQNLNFHPTILNKMVQVSQDSLSRNYFFNILLNYFWLHVFSLPLLPFKKKKIMKNALIIYLIEYFFFLKVRKEMQLINWISYELFINRIGLSYYSVWNHNLQVD